jgi:hypothetical protein
MNFKVGDKVVHEDLEIGEVVESDVEYIEVRWRGGASEYRQDGRLRNASIDGHVWIRLLTPLEKILK